MSRGAALEPLRLRAAVAADQAAIRSIVRAAGIYPLGLSWRRFTVAEERGRVVGVVQIRAHHDGSRELASLAVVPDRRSAAIATRLVRLLQEREPTPLHLTCRDALEPFYRRLGFRVVDEQGQLRPHMRIFLNRTIERDLGLAVAEGDEVVLMQALSGG